MQCPRCGQAMASTDQAYCADCGAALRAPAPLPFDLTLPTGTANAAALMREPAAAAAPSSMKGALGWLAVLAILLWKFKVIALSVLLKAKSLFVLAKLGKVVTTLSSMMLSIVLYAQTWGWRFAVAFCMLTLVHELGHVIVAWRKGVPVSAPLFIPGLGALIRLHQSPRDALTESHIGYGGPALGAMGDTIAWALSFATGQPVLLAAANFSMLVNLFNLAPVSPLDGGRIVAAVAPRLWLLGLVAMAGWFLVTHSPIVLLVVIFGGLRLGTQWKTMGTSEYFAVPPRDRLIMTAAYVGLALYLGWAQATTHTQMMSWFRARGVSA